MPSLLWRGATGLAVSCHVDSVRRTDAGAVAARLCAAAVRLASPGAPIPVRLAGSARSDIGTVALMIQARLQPAAAVVPGAHGDLLTFSVLPLRSGVEPDAFQLGTAPRAVVTPSGAVEGTALESALRNALAETLPWLARPGEHERGKMKLQDGNLQVSGREVK